MKNLSLKAKNCVSYIICSHYNNNLGNFCKLKAPITNFRTNVMINVIEIIF